MTTTDQDRGVQHRHGCPEPGWTVQTSRAMPAWQIVRCAGCGVLRLARPEQIGVTR